MSCSSADIRPFLQKDLNPLKWTKGLWGLTPCLIITRSIAKAESILVIKPRALAASHYFHQRTNHGVIQ